MRTLLLTPVASFMLLASFTLCAADVTPSGPQPLIPRKSPELVIQMPGKEVLLSQYRSFVCAVAFMSTTCPHCQYLATVLGPIQKEYATKGVQVLGVVFNPEANAELPNFAALYAKNMFPIGMSTEPAITEYLQHPPGIHYIPMMAFIDKHAIIRAEKLGLTDGPFFQEAVVVQNVKGELDKILKEPTISLTAAAPKKK